MTTRVVLVAALVVVTIFLIMQAIILLAPFAAIFLVGWACVKLYRSLETPATQRPANSTSLDVTPVSAPNDVHI